MNKLCALLLILFLTNCTDQSLVFSDVLCITNVDIIDVEKGHIADRTVVIKEGKIIYIGDGTPLTVEGESEVIDAEGKYMIPGLWDAHVHFSYIEALAPKMFDLFLAYGITSVRDTGGNLNFVSKWKYLSEKDSTNAPRVKIAGPLMDGSPNVYDGSSPARPKLSVELEGTQDVIMNADILIEAGVDLIKAYEMLTPAQFTVLNNYAAGNGLKVTGHVPLSMDVIAASNAGFDSMEHLRNLEMSCASNSDELLQVRRKMLAEGVKNKDTGHALRSRLHASQRYGALDNQDEQRTAEVLTVLAKNQTWQIPTLALLTASSERPFASEEWQSTFDFLPENIAQRFSEGVETFLETPVSDNSKKYTDWGLDITKKINDAGIGIMAGTDCPIFFLTPGRSLHEELEKLSEAGLTNLEVLETATTRPAEYFNMDNELGLIKTGYHADLVLLNANPIDDISNTLDIHAVIKAGRYHSRDRLMGKLQNGE